MANNKIKGIIYISNVTKAMEHEWFADEVDQTKFELRFVLFNSRDSELYKYLADKGFSVKNYKFRSNYLLPYYIFYFWVDLLFRRPDFIHCHLFQAGLIGIVASYLAGIKKRIYTRHHADVHHVYHPHAVKYDMLVNRLSTHIIAVSSNSYRVLTKLEHVPAKKITVINHGIPLALMDKKIQKTEIDTILLKYQLENKHPLIGVISRFVPEKGIQYIIPAFKMLLADFPSAHLVLANAKGRYADKIHLLLNELPKGSFTTITFENNIEPLFSAFDVFVHAPIDDVCEAFGQVYIEAMSHGVPMVCTISGIACDLVTDKKNALVANYKDADSIFQCLRTMLRDDKLRNDIIKQAHEDVKEHTFEKKFEKIMKIYLS